ncbi:MAG: M81 family metallopeptidase [Desulfotignum sp.]
MKFVIAQMLHESHTFIPQLTTLGDFNPLGGGAPFEGENAVAALRGRNSGATAFLDLAESTGADAVVPIAGQALPSGPVEDAAFEYFCEKITAAVKKGCDAVLLDLHGAMATPGYPDAEGELLYRIRSIAPEIPIALALDFHCIITPKMVDHATVVSIYRTTPHIDMYETGQRAGRILLNHLRGKCEAVTVARRIPLMASLENMGNGTPPMKQLIEMLQQMEADHSEILCAGLSGGHPFSDIAPGGMTAVLVTDNNPEKGAAAAEKLLKTAWDSRNDLIYQIEPIRKSLKYAKSLDEGPVIMADSGDIPSSGGYGADMTVLKEAIAMGFADMAVGPVFDPASARTMFAAGVGSEMTLALGGKTQVPLLNYVSEPMQISGIVKAVSDEPITLTGPMLKGLTISLGRMAVLSTGSMEIMVTEKRGEAIDLGILTHMGINPAEKKYMLIKSRQHFRAAFGPIARHMLWVCGPGPTCSDVTGFPFAHIERPVFPLDKDVRYHLDRLGKW